MYTCIAKTMQIVLERGSIDGMPNTYACKGVSNPNVPIFPPRVCTLVLFIVIVVININTHIAAIAPLPLTTHPR